MPTKDEDGRHQIISEFEESSWSRNLSKSNYNVVMISPAPKKEWLIDSFQKDEPAAQIWWLQCIHN